MGFFGKLKQNFTHGGVKVKIQAPASVSMQDASVPVAVAVTAGDSPQTVSKVSVEIIAESRSQAFNQGGDANSITMNTVARSEDAQQFSLAPGESKTVQLAIVMNAGAAIAQQLPDDGAATQIAEGLAKLQNVAQALDPSAATYTIVAKADVQGIALDPSDKQPIQILKPGELGGAVNIRL